MEYILSNGDVLKVEKKNIHIDFSGKRQVLSTSVLNGGFRDDLKSVFNFDEKDDNGVCSMEEQTYEEHLQNVAVNIGLDPDLCSGLSTSVYMKNYAVKEERFTLPDGFELAVTAISTGGINRNGARAGDPTDWMECNGQYFCMTEADREEHKTGTINTFIHVNAHLAPGCMARALVMAAEAKTTAVGDLLCPSCFGEGIATGSGTDGTMIICESKSPHNFNHAGKDYKLGEMIAKAVYGSVQKTIGNHTGVTPESQRNVFKILGRFGIDEKRVSEALDSDRTEAVKRLSEDPKQVVKALGFSRVMDQINCGMLTPQEGGYFLNREVSDKEGLKQAYVEEFIKCLDIK